jgi:hypothetical protein
MDRILMVPILQNSVVALIFLFLHYVWVSGKLKGRVVSGTSSRIGKEKGERGRADREKGGGRERWVNRAGMKRNRDEGRVRRKRMVKGCPTKKY